MAVLVSLPFTGGAMVVAGTAERSTLEIIFIVESGWEEFSAWMDGTAWVGG